MLYVGVVSAQTVCTPTCKFAFEEAGPSLPTVQSYIYSAYDGSATTPTTLTNVVCNGTTSPFTCITPIPSYADGSHIVAVTANTGYTPAGESGRSNSISFLFLNIPAIPSNLHGIAVLDIFPRDVYISADNLNYSNTPQLQAHTWPNQIVYKTILMKFILPTLPPGIIVQSATLSMTLVDADLFYGNYRVTAQRLLKDFNPDSVTGLTTNGVDPWTVKTGYTFPIAQADISPPYGYTGINRTQGPKSWDITRLVQEWVTDPSINLGLMLNADTRTGQTDHFRSFASMRDTDPVKWPYLRIVFASQ